MIKLSKYEIDRIIGMAMEDRTPFDSIKQQFNINHGEIIKLMCKQLSEKSFKKWRKRMNGRKTKHKKNFEKSFYRFKSKNQK